MRNILLVSALGLLAAPVQSQSAAPSSIGQRVWVRSRTGSGALDTGVKGTLEGFTGDSLQVRSRAGGPTVSVGLGAATQLFVSTGRRSSVGRGAAIGGGVGALAGAVIGFAAGQDCSPGEWLCFDRGTVAAGAAIALGGVGLVGGIIVGALSSHDTWGRAGWPETVRPVVVPNPHGVGLGLSFSF